MATSKTLAPTNVTISIPAMADAPDASVFSNCVDKEADAINALNSKIVTGTMVIACNAGKTQVSYANLPSGKPSSQGAFLQSLYQCVNHGSAAEMTTVCIDGVDLIIQTATAQNVTIRWFYFGTA